MLSQRQAAQAWGVSRATLQRAITGGKLSISVDGRIDPSEMLRAFGEAKATAKGGPHEPPSEPLGPPMSHPEIEALRAEVQALKAKIEAQSALVAAKDQNLSDLRNTVRLLQAPRRSLWQRLFG